MKPDSISEFFDLEPMSKAEVVPVAVPSSDEQDHDNVRKIYYELIAQSKDALDNLIAFAKSAESPRAFEVVSGLIKTTADVAKNLSDLTAGNKKPDTQNNTQNNIFVGSTAELQKLIKNEPNP
mgnify:CR=1 FL=1|tara:strand:+ start:131 stop:499 length:369 start_codon:yes stop_codon:yes gene_type:complete